MLLCLVVLLTVFADKHHQLTARQSVYTHELHARHKLTVATSPIHSRHVFTVLTVGKSSIMFRHRSLKTSPCITLSLHTFGVSSNVQYQHLQID